MATKQIAPWMPSDELSECNSKSKRNWGKLLSRKSSYRCKTIITSSSIQWSSHEQEVAEPLISPLTTISIVHQRLPLIYSEDALNIQANEQKLMNWDDGSQYNWLQHPKLSCSKTDVRWFTKMSTGEPKKLETCSSWPSLEIFAGNSSGTFQMIESHFYAFKQTFWNICFFVEL